MNQKKVTDVIGMLGHIKSRPGMYVGKEYSRIIFYLSGFNLACTLASLPNLHDTQEYRNIVTEHGWDNFHSVWTQMREQDIDETTALDEVLSIEIEAWKKLMHNIDE